MDEYLKVSHKNLVNLNNLTKVHIILGNEAGDLDSVISSIATAYFVAKNENKTVFPVINIPKKELPLRTEVIYFLKKVGISPDLLISRDDIDLKQLHLKGQLELVLVDHNQLPMADVGLESSIVEIIDHHHDVRNLNVTKSIELVGSCSTLIAERILKTNPAIMESTLALLLYGTILLDTVCLSDAAKRVTPKDKEIAHLLKTKYLDPKLNPELLFQELQAAKSDIKSLSTTEVLQKDFKTISDSSLTFSLPSIPCLLEEFCQRPDLSSTLSEFAKLHNAHAIILLGLEVSKDTSNVRRQLGVFSANTTLSTQIIQFLNASNAPPLQLTRIDTILSSLNLFEQGNIGASRKAILPLLLQHLQAKSFVPSLQFASTEEEFGEFDPLIIDESYPASPRIKSNISSLDSSAQNSCPYTPQNSYVEDIVSTFANSYMLPSFNNKDMVEKIRRKREKLGALTQETGSVPFTPNNSYVESTSPRNFLLSVDFDKLPEQVRQKQASLTMNRSDL